MQGHRMPGLLRCLLCSAVTLLSAPCMAAQPNFEGTWSFGSLTPLQRPENLADKSHFTEEEALAFEDDFDRYIREVFREGAGDGFVGDDLWLDFGTYVEPDLRTSRLIDPPTGRFPEPTEAGQRNLDYWNGLRETYAGPEVLGWNERCIFAGVPYMRAPDNNILTIVQTEDYLALDREFAHGLRIIKLISDVFAPDHIRTWNGSSVARWEDDALRIVTRNFRPDYGIGASGPGLELTETLSLQGDMLLRYELTARDEEMLTQSWTMLTYMRRTDTNTPATKATSATCVASCTAPG